MRGLSPIGALLLISGCVAVSPQPASSVVDLELQPTLTKGYQAQASVARKTAGDIHRLEILPYVQTGTRIFQPISRATGEATSASDPDLIKLSQATPSIDFDRPVTLRNLRANTTYRIFAQAYDAQDSLISTTDGFSYVEVEVRADDAPRLPVKLPIKLVDTPFAATARVVVSATGATNRLKKVDGRLYALVQGSEVPVSNAAIAIPVADLPRTLSLLNLQAHTTYRLAAEAEDPLGATLARNAVDLPVTTDDSLEGRSLPLSIPEYPLAARVRP